MQAAEELTQRQREVLTFFSESFRANGAPPTIRTVMRRFNFKTPRGAQIHLIALSQKGYLIHDRHRHPAYWPVSPRGISDVPILGSAPAGHAADHPEDYRGQLLLPWSFSDRAFALKVVGESMRDAHVLDGDLVVVDPLRQGNDGDIVLAQLRGEHTIKTLRKTKASWELHPQNRDFEVQYPSEERDHVVGAVVALVRRTSTA